MESPFGADTREDEEREQREQPPLPQAPQVQPPRTSGSGSGSGGAARRTSHASRQGRRRWTPNELLTLVQLHAAHGNKWALIARSLRHRSDNDVKNIFHSALRSALRSHTTAAPGFSPSCDTNTLVRTYAQAVGANCDDPQTRQQAYEVARKRQDEEDAAADIPPSRGFRGAVARAASRAASAFASGPAAASSDPSGPAGSAAAGNRGASSFASGPVSAMTSSEAAGVGASAVASAPTAPLDRLAGELDDLPRRPRSRRQRVSVDLSGGGDSLVHPTPTHMPTHMAIVDLHESSLADLFGSAAGLGPLGPGAGLSLGGGAGGGGVASGDVQASGLPYGLQILEGMTQGQNLGPGGPGLGLDLGLGLAAMQAAFAQPPAVLAPPRPYSAQPHISQQLPSGSEGAAGALDSHMSDSTAPLSYNTTAAVQLVSPTAQAGGVHGGGGGALQVPPGLYPWAEDPVGSRPLTPTSAPAWSQPGPAAAVASGAAAVGLGAVGGAAAAPPLHSRPPPPPSSLLRADVSMEAVGAAPSPPPPQPPPPLPPLWESLALLQALRPLQPPAAAPVADDSGSRSALVLGMGSTGGHRRRTLDVRRLTGASSLPSGPRAASPPDYHGPDSSSSDYPLAGGGGGGDGGGHLTVDAILDALGPWQAPPAAAGPGSSGTAAGLAAAAGPAAAAAGAAASRFFGGGEPATDAPFLGAAPPAAGAAGLAGDGSSDAGGLSSGTAGGMSSAASGILTGGGGEGGGRASAPLFSCPAAGSQTSGVSAGLLSRVPSAAGGPITNSHHSGMAASPFVFDSSHSSQSQVLMRPSAELGFSSLPGPMDLPLRHESSLVGVGLGLVRSEGVVTSPSEPWMPPPGLLHPQAFLEAQLSHPPPHGARPQPQPAAGLRPTTAHDPAPALQPPTALQPLHAHDLAAAAFHLQAQALGAAGWLQPLPLHQHHTLYAQHLQQQQQQQQAQLHLQQQPGGGASRVSAAAGLHSFASQELGSREFGALLLASPDGSGGTGAGASVGSLQPGGAGSLPLSAGASGHSEPVDPMQRDLISSQAQLQHLQRLHVQQLQQLRQIHVAQQQQLLAQQQQQPQQHAQAQAHAQQLAPAEMQRLLALGPGAAPGALGSWQQLQALGDVTAISAQAHGTLGGAGSLPQRGGVPARPPPSLPPSYLRDAAPIGAAGAGALGPGGFQPPQQPTRHPPDRAALGAQQPGAQVGPVPGPMETQRGQTPSDAEPSMADIWKKMMDMGDD